jgi:serine/threonine-protein kinase RsbT
VVQPSLEQVRIPIQSDTDVVTARQTGRMLATRLAFSSSDSTIVATAISELARNIVLYASRGEMILAVTRQDARPGLVITAWDEGPGIADIEWAMKDGYSSCGRLGVGLPGVKRLMDEFEIVSVVGKGTTVTAKKWRGSP